MSALTDTFTAIANKIRAKLGVQTTYTPAEMPTGIEAVYAKGVSDTKVGTAAAGDVLSGKTFTNSSSVGANGSMTNKGSTDFTITNTSAVTIPAGYYNGSGKIQTSGMMVTPTDTKSITANGSNIDVLSYAKANVNVKISPNVTITDYRNQTNGANTLTINGPFTNYEKYVIIFCKGVKYDNTIKITITNALATSNEAHYSVSDNSGGSCYNWGQILVTPDTNKNSFSISIDSTGAFNSQYNSCTIIVIKTYT